MTDALTTIARSGKLGQLAKGAKPADMAAMAANPGRYVIEIKYDGHRMYAHHGIDGTVTLYARSGADKTHKWPRLVEAMRHTPRGTWLDGEAVMLTADNDDWGSVQSALGSDDGRGSEHLTFVAFDLLGFGEHDVRSRPLAERRVMLERLVAEADAPIALAPQYPLDQAADRYAEWTAAGWEGAIIKDTKAPYVSGKRTQLKLKVTVTIDAVIHPATTLDGEGKYTGQIGALVFGQYDAAGNLVERGRCSGMTDDLRAEMSAALQAGTLVGTVIEVQHMGAMPTGGLRHPQYKRTRTDKAPKACLVSNE